VFLEVKRVLAPGGLFLFVQEPIRRLLSLRLYRCPYERQMKPWERKLNQWDCFGYLVKDVIGAHQEENFGIRQNHRMTLPAGTTWFTSISLDARYEITPADRGWGEHFVRIAARNLSRSRSEWHPARLLGVRWLRCAARMGRRQRSFSRPRGWRRTCGVPIVTTDCVPIAMLSSLHELRVRGRE
jgi:hypothetical protein